MRIAVVGRIKAGKSTAMNALLGETLVATGTVEATFNINWLKYGPQPALMVHYKDSNHPPEPKSPQELAALTLRSEDPETLKFLHSIKYIEVFHPNSILQSLDLIDTPGLASSYEADSENTQEFLKLHGEELTRTTEAQVSEADAILYLFSHSSLAESDQKIIELFQGPSVGRATPLNAIGVYPGRFLLACQRRPSFRSSRHYPATFRRLSSPIQSFLQDSTDCWFISTGRTNPNRKRYLYPAKIIYPSRTRKRYFRNPHAICKTILRERIFRQTRYPIHRRAHCNIQSA
jgi:GTPase SAR1 family protein